jgi:hypothetical protein
VEICVDNMDEDGLIRNKETKTDFIIKEGGKINRQGSKNGPGTTQEHFTVWSLYINYSLPLEFS